MLLDDGGGVVRSAREEERVVATYWFGSYNSVDKVSYTILISLQSKIRFITSTITAYLSQTPLLFFSQVYCNQGLNQSFWTLVYSTAHILTLIPKSGTFLPFFVNWWGKKNLMVKSYEFFFIYKCGYKIIKYQNIINTYLVACGCRHASFTLLVSSVDWMLRKEFLSLKQAVWRNLWKVA